MNVSEMSAAAREASYTLPMLKKETRESALRHIAEKLNEHKNTIFDANKADMDAAVKEALPAPLLARLLFDESKLRTVTEGINNLAGLEDTVGKTMLSRELTDGLALYRVTCPIGVLGVIFESRPDALVQIASLCVKSGNAVLMKGGREALNTNKALFEAICQAGKEAGLPDGWIGLCETRDDVNEMLEQYGLIDLIIPRGSNAFVKYIMDHTHIPVMGHADGICHVYIDSDADIPMAVQVTTDAKTNHYAVCNAAETLLVHSKAAPAFLPAIKKALDEKQVEIRGDKRTRGYIDCLSATEEDWRTEYLDAIISIRVVDSVEEAISHINHYGSHHTDAIITENKQTASLFCAKTDSAGVYVNCSTRFADGFRYGFGAEVGISTSRLHARGPVGVEGLLTYKYILNGNGNTVGETKVYTHRDSDLPCPLF